MPMHSQEITVNWGESDPFGLVYYPKMLQWFNDTEHDLFRQVSHPIDGMIKHNKTTFVMGEVHFRFIGPAAYGDRVTCIIALHEMRERTLHWNCKAFNTRTGAPITEGRAIRVFAKINDDGTLTSARIPDDIREALNSMGEVTLMQQDLTGADYQSPSQ